MQALIADFDVDVIGIYMDPYINVSVYKILKEVSGTLKIFFDEDMAIDPEANFLDKFKAVCEKYYYKTIDDPTITKLTSEINNLLQSLESCGWVYRGDRYVFMRGREGTERLSSYNYQIVKKHLERGHIAESLFKPSIYCVPRAVPLPNSHPDLAAFNLDQAKFYFIKGAVAVYCVDTEKMVVNLTTSVYEADKFYSKEASNDSRI